MSNVKIAAAFEEFIGYCSGYGGSYNPGSPNLKLSALIELSEKSRQVMEAMNVTNSEMNLATNNREIAFAGLPKLASSITFALAASGASEQTMNDVRAIIRQMTSRRKSRKPIASGAAVPEQKGRSIGQRSFVSMTNHLARLVQLLREEPLYQPLESHLSIAGLEDHVAKLRSLTTMVNEARVSFSNARIALVRTYYTDTHSVVATGRSAKKYVRSVFGLNSIQYDQVKRINFTKPKF